MRLSSAQVETIKQEIEHFFGTKVEVWSLDSHVDDTATGVEVQPINELVRQQGVRL